jgi:hypothetical protein
LRDHRLTPAEPADDTIRTNHWLRQLESLPIVLELSDIHNEAFYLQVVVGSNTERLTDDQSGISASSNEGKYVILRRDNI